MRKASMIVGWAASMGLVTSAYAEPPALQDSQRAQPQGTLQGDKGAKNVRPKVYGTERRASKFVVTDEMRTAFPKKSAEKELVVRFQGVDDGYLVYGSELTPAMRAKVAAYKKVPLREIPRRTTHRIRLELQEERGLRRLSRRKGEKVRLQLKQDRNGRYAVRDVLPLSR